MHTTIIDFIQPVENIEIITDATERAAGLSHAYTGYQDSINNKSYFFFAHLEPQPNGAAFASFKIEGGYNLENITAICLKGKSLNASDAFYQLIIDTDESTSLGFTYKYDFKIAAKNQFSHRFIFEQFTATRRGDPFPNPPYLNVSHIISIGLRIVGRAGPSSNILQQGLYGVQLFNITTSCDS